MLADEHPQMDFVGPERRGGSPVHLHLYVEDADAVAGRALDAGAKLVRKVEDQFYGDRLGTVQDPYGHVWHIATHKEDLSHEEMRRRAEAQAGRKT
jgi:PhnB protein